ncbi:DUF4405 domain-containing protein [Pelolinea submarina]|uniref:Uncharacterized protein DUF4405 n=1 Tax=Pelolinea submarina TaxID=913107 RepID=A0A347ZSC7_9CHLR|nr:DUF4405 domain-containing protein [Pelolinea submarina]REG11227.1 uncharacterized protein DUF4405 [Pelolinea submarina]BBB48208.1 hypothetical protein Pelsub_P1436 [Pelolinea submarina]
MSEYQYVLSAQTRQRYWLVTLLIVIGLALTASSVYFLYFPNGYQGGRNPDYNTSVLFNRTDWSQIHLWSGIAMIIILLIHIPVHWKWIMDMGKRCFGKTECKIGRLNPHAKFNLYLDAAAAASFMLAAISGIYFLFVPAGRQASAPTFIFDYSAWDVIHTWSGVIMIILSLAHFLYHHGWVMKVSKRVMKREKVVETV